MSNFYVICEMSLFGIGIESRAHEFTLSAGGVPANTDLKGLGYENNYT